MSAVGAWRAEFDRTMERAPSPGVVTPDRVVAAAMIDLACSVERLVSFLAADAERQAAEHGALVAAVDRLAGVLDERLKALVPPVAEVQAVRR